MNYSGEFDLKAKIDDLRGNLLDMSMRNNLLNFRELKRSIPIVDENCAELFQILVFDEEEMEFLANDSSEYNENQDENLGIDSDKLWDLPQNTDVLDKHKDLFLQSNFSPKELQKRLFGIYQNSKNSLEEKGYNNLYLALGFLEWNESEDEDEDSLRRAPLILIPIKIKRKSVNSPYSITWSNEEIQPNLSLQHKIKDQGIDFPDFKEFESKEDIYAYYKSIEDSISLIKHWKVNYEVYLDIFNFRKFIMYRDLELDNWSKEDIENSNIGNLFNPRENDSLGSSFDESNIDRLIDPSDVFHVMDADSSQIAVLEEVKRKGNLVVEGPPGTGKSQTIINLIAELLANGKSVLFVCEKMAALEVVKNRLEEIGLGSACLELHR